MKTRARREKSGFHIRRETDCQPNGGTRKKASNISRRTAIAQRIQRTVWPTIYTSAHRYRYIFTDWNSLRNTECVIVRALWHRTWLCCCRANSRRGFFSRLEIDPYPNIGLAGWLLALYQTRFTSQENRVLYTPPPPLCIYCIIVSHRFSLPFYREMADPVLFFFLQPLLLLSVCAHVCKPII